MPSHMLYETHSFSKTAFDILANFLRFDILSQNSMRFCFSIAKSNAFFTCHHFIAKSNAFLHFYRKIKCVALFETKTKVFSTNSCNPPIKNILVEISNILVRISNISVNITSIYVKITNILVKFSF